MTIKIKSSTKIMELIKEHPFLMDELIKEFPKLRKLNNPVLRRTIGKHASLNDVSKLANISQNLLFQKITEIIKKHSGEEKDCVKIDIDKNEDDSAEWTAELERRQKKMKDLVLKLHSNNDPGILKELRAEFDKIVKDVSAGEIAEMEQALIESGELTAEQITSMCDFHVDLFKESLNTQTTPGETPGHPIHTYNAENEKSKEIIEEIRSSGTDEDKRANIEKLKKISFHYKRMQNQLFPQLEKVGISGPSSVMWAKQDEILELFRNIDEHLKDISAPIEESKKVKEILQAVEEMNYKEQNILYPMALENLGEEDWMKVKMGEEEIGFSWIKPGDEWKPISPMDIHKTDFTAHSTESAAQQYKKSDDTTTNIQSTILPLNTGRLSLKEIDLILRKLPVDLSFIGADEKVKYYSNTEDRIFPRSPGVIGREVIKCHPPKSYDKVNEILTAFKEGKKNTATFWIQMNEAFIVIKYFAIRDDDGTFLGTLEVSQEISKLRALEGDRRLVDWD